MSLPHVSNSTAGRNKYEAVILDTFEVYFTLPEALRAQFGQDEALLTEHVTKIDGLGALNKGPEKTTQKYQGTTRTFLKNKIDDTSADLTITLTLNLRNKVDNYIFKLFKAWQDLGYDKETGVCHLKDEYTADWLRIAAANRAGDIYRDITFKDVFTYGDIGGLDSYDYSSNDPVELEIHMVSDWWHEENA